MGGRIFVWGEPEQYGNYRGALESAGARLCLSRELEKAQGCHGLLLPGGGDMEPWRYGQANTASRDLDPLRDGVELTLLAQFAAAGKPVLGICRGAQVINVFFGGTLRQDVPGHSAASRDRLHRVRTLPKAPAAFGGDPVVNSAHHQTVGLLGRGLRPVQTAPDGTVEALLHTSLPIWGVQWHPERLSGPLAVSGAAEGEGIFRGFLGLLR